MRKVLYTPPDTNNLCTFCCSVKNIKPLLPEELDIPLFLGSISGFLSHDYSSKIIGLDNRHISTECQTNKNLLEVELAIASSGLLPTNLLNLPKGTVIMPLGNVLQITRCFPVKGSFIACASNQCRNTFGHNFI